MVVVEEGVVDIDFGNCCDVGEGVDSGGGM